MFNLTFVSAVRAGFLPVRAVGVGLVVALALVARGESTTFGADIIAPAQIDTCSGLVEIYLVPEQGHTYEWFLIHPENLICRTWPDNSRIIFAAPSKACVIHFAVLDIEIERPEDASDGELPLADAEVCRVRIPVIKSDDHNHENGEENGEENGGEKPEKLVVLIFEETARRTTELDQLWQEVRTDPDLAKHQILIVDDDVSNPALAAYMKEGDASDNPIICLDVDFDANATLHRGVCPSTLAGIKDLVGEHSADGEPRIPIPAVRDDPGDSIENLAPSKQTATDGGSEPTTEPSSNDAPPSVADFSLVNVKGSDGKVKLYACNRKTGARYLVTDGKFCTDDGTCYEVRK